MGDIAHDLRKQKKDPRQGGGGVICLKVCGVFHPLGDFGLFAVIPLPDVGVQIARNTADAIEPYILTEEACLLFWCQLLKI